MKQTNEQTQRISHRSLPSQGRLATITQAAACFALLVLTFTQSARAENARSFVSSNGNDHNDCTLAHPCRTLQRAHENTVDWGEVDVLDAGYYLPLRITRPITIDGGNLALIYSDTDGMAIQNTTGAVTIRNMSFQNPYSGLAIGWYSGPELRVENVTISQGGGVIVYPQYSSLVSTAPGIRHLYMHNVAIVNSGGAVNVVPSYGPPAPTLVLTPVRTTIDHCALEGGAADPSVGLNLSYGAARITNSIISNFSTALSVAGAELDLANSSVTDSTFAISVHGSSGDVGGGVVRLAENNIHNNTTALSVTGGGQILSFGNNRIAGNKYGETPTATINLK